MSFLAPWLLGGLVLASAPIIIHLLNRRRYQLVEWGPMRYLKQTLRRNRRRVRLEQWLLLLLRTLAVLLLFLALAKPLLSGAAAALGQGLGGGRVSHIVVIDDTLSMGLRGGGGTAFEDAKQAAAELVESMQSGDRLTLVTTSLPGSPVLRDVPVDDPAALARRVRDLPLTDLSADWSAVLQQLDPALDAASLPLRQVTLATDLRAEGWSDPVADWARRWAEEDRPPTVRVLDAGRPAGPNATLAGLTPLGPALVGRDVPLRATLGGAGVASDATAQLTVGDEAGSLRLPETGVVSAAGLNWLVEARPMVTGPTPVTLSLPDDVLPGDDTRRLVLDSVEALDVTLVDGEPGMAARDGETFFPALAMSVGGAGGRVWQITRIDDTQWHADPPGSPDLLVLANVERVEPARAAVLAEQVRAGMGLLVFVGDRMDLEAWGSALGDGGEGLLPGDLGVPREVEAVAGLLVGEQAGRGTPWSAMTGLATGLLQQVRPTRLMPVEPNEDVDVLATWNDGQQSPAVLARDVGAGRVVLVTTTADRAWGDWPVQRSYVLALRLAALTAVRTTAGDLLAGEPWRVELLDRPLPSEALLTRPGVDEAEPVVVQAAGADGEPAMLVVEDTRLAGHYELRWTPPGQDERRAVVAVNPDPRESDLTPLAEGRLESLLAGLEVQRVAAAGPGQTVAQAEGAQLWKTLIVGVLLLLLGESLLAWWVDRER